ncbi:MAG TPA: alanine racemase [Burkholderiaceae bacterium]|nr:alanine racemase [Burkholderiaceae bacterium]
MPRPIRALIRPRAVAHNLEVARRRIDAARVWAVVKANAYGHGIERVLSGLAEADGLALLDLDEAARARAAGWTRPVLLLEGWFEPRDIEIVDRLDLTAMVHTSEQIDMLESTRVSGPLDVYVKLNSGMNRLGFKGDAFIDAVTRLRALPHIGRIAYATHFADADSERGIDAACQEFKRATRGMEGVVSLANSAATLRYAGARSDWVRAGIMLYGSSPFTERSAASLDLRPSMVLRSQLIGIQPVQPGETVGYGSTFTAERATRIGIVACGYADGYPRHAPSGTPVWVDGVRCPIAGRVSMDMITVDLEAAPHARVGSPVELWGDHVPIDEVAHAAKTIAYELMCALAPRVPVNVDDGI